jgi:hypothetical protein
MIAPGQPITEENVGTCMHLHVLCGDGTGSCALCDHHLPQPPAPKPDSFAAEDACLACNDDPETVETGGEVERWEAEAERITEAVVKRAPDMLRRATESVYETMLYDVQDYLRENVLFNLSTELSSAKRRADEAEATVNRQVSRIAELEAERAKDREVLTSIARNTCCGTCQEAALSARSRLKGEGA